jgi:hypothetical protein
MTEQDRQEVLGMIADQFDSLEQTVEAMTAEAIDDLTPEVIREQVRNVLTEDGASVDDNEEVPIVANPDQNATMMPAVEYDSEGNARRYVRVSVSVLSRLAALQVDSQHIGIKTMTLGSGNVSISPNILYIDDDDGQGKPSTNISLSPGDISGDVAEYMLRVRVLSDNRTVTFPNNITWSEGEPPEFAIGVTYEISILDGLAIYAEWEGD